MITAQREPTARFRQLVTAIYEADLTRAEMVQILTAAGTADADSMSMANLALCVVATANDPGAGNNSLVTDFLSDASGESCDSDSIGDWNVTNTNQL